MSNLAKKEDNNEEIVVSIHRFSNEAFKVAKSFVTGSDVEPLSDVSSLKEKASDLKSQLPEFAALMQEADQGYRADLNRALSNARLDLEYVLADGKRPSSTRLYHIIRDQESGGGGY
ncbi:MAG: hypothetical protein DWQ04_34865 [Chloroflexi bacterium]|nr:MAG: hypothetical protein DWQ04_34865 [Chloroflexota bacterium]